MIVAALLAAGESRRMGRPKLGLDLGGESILDRSLSVLLASPVERVLAVISPPMSLRTIHPRLETIMNDRPWEGLSRSIRLAVAAVPGDCQAMLLSLADKPLVRPETVGLVVACWKATGADVVYPRHHGEQGHPVLVARSLFDELAKLTGDSGAKTLLRGDGRRIESVDVDDPGAVLDIDTPDDYAKVLNNFRRPIEPV
jgi:molybdenum cofactor cytidylyltransferase